MLNIQLQSYVMESPLNGFYQLVMLTGNTQLIKHLNNKIRKINKENKLSLRSIFMSECRKEIRFI